MCLIKNKLLLSYMFDFLWNFKLLDNNGVNLNCFGYLNSYVNNLNIITIYINIIFIENIILVLILYFFFKTLIMSSILELVWPTHLFNKKNNFSYSNVKNKLFLEILLKTNNINTIIIVLINKL